MSAVFLPVVTHCRTRSRNHPCSCRYHNARVQLSPSRPSPIYRPSPGQLIPPLDTFDTPDTPDTPNTLNTVDMLETPAIPNLPLQTPLLNQVYTQGNTKLANIYLRRFKPEYLASSENYTLSIPGGG